MVFVELPAPIANGPRCTRAKKGQRRKSFGSPLDLRRSERYNFGVDLELVVVMHHQERQVDRATQQLLAVVAVCLVCLLTTDCASLVHRKRQVAPVVGTLIVRADTDDSTRREVVEVVDHLKKAAKRFTLVSDETDADYLLFVASLTNGTDDRESWTRAQKVLGTLAGLLAALPGGGGAPSFKHPGTLKVYMCVKDRGSWRAGPVLSFEYGSTMNRLEPHVMAHAVAWAETNPPDRCR